MGTRRTWSVSGNGSKIGRRLSPAGYLPDHVLIRCHRDRNYKSNFKKPGKDGMGIYRAILISGPPGIGKTTSAHLMAKEAGYNPIELNASDARSKKLVEVRSSSTQCGNELMAQALDEYRQRLVGRFLQGDRCAGKPNCISVRATLTRSEYNSRRRPGRFEDMPDHGRG